jgi:uncharacterized membrane protein
MLHCWNDAARYSIVGMTLISYSFVEIILIGYSTVGLILIGCCIVGMTLIALSRMLAVKPVIVPLCPP